MYSIYQQEFGRLMSTVENGRTKEADGESAFHLAPCGSERATRIDRAPGALAAFARCRTFILTPVAPGNEALANLCVSGVS